MCYTCKDGGALSRWAGRDEKGVIDCRASRTVNGRKRFARGLESLRIKVAKADADRTVFLHT